MMRPICEETAALMRSLSKPRPCNGCRKVTVEGPYLCDDCYAKAEARRRDESYSTALESIPLKYRWATREHEALMRRVTGGGDTIRSAMDAALEGRSILLIGETTRGKTSLACACLRAIIDAGKGDAGLKARVRAAGVRFVDALTIAKSRAQWSLGHGEAPEMESALRASCLVLDELGGERHDSGPVAELLHERHAADKQTIVTTPWSKAKVSERYGDGIARRLWEGVVLNLGGAR